MEEIKAQIENCHHLTIEPHGRVFLAEEFLIKILDYNHANTRIITQDMTAQEKVKIISELRGKKRTRIFLTEYAIKNILAMRIKRKNTINKLIYDYFGVPYENRQEIKKIKNDIDQATDEMDVDEIEIELL